MAAMTLFRAEKNYTPDNFNIKGVCLCVLLCFMGHAA